MKEYLKNEIKHIPMMLLLLVLFYGIVAFATGNYLFNSSDVEYDNTNSGIQSTNVADAIDELYNHATDYNEIKTTIGNSTLTTTNQTLIGGINEVNSRINKYGGISNPGTVNNATLIGTYFAKASECAGLPTSSASDYYSIACFGVYQIATLYGTGTAFPKGTFLRYYINNQWYNWEKLTSVDNIPSDTIEVEIGMYGTSKLYRKRLTSIGTGNRALSLGGIKRGNIIRLYVYAVYADGSYTYRIEPYYHSSSDYWNYYIYSNTYTDGAMDFLTGGNMATKQSTIVVIVDYVK